MSVRAVAILFPALLACGTGDDVAPGPSPGPTGLLLRCATNAIPGTTFPIQAARVEVEGTGTDGDFRVRIVRWYLHVHDGQPPMDPVVAEHDATGAGDASVWDLDWPGGGLLAARGGTSEPALAGALVFGEPKSSLPVWCWEPGREPAARYDAATGQCLDPAGKVGRTETPIAFVRETRLGECASLDLVSLNGDDLGYPELKGWDLRGASLRGARMFFANLHEARLEGADLTGFEFGYAEVTGTVDAHTIVPPEDMGCKVAGTALSCRR